MIKFVMYVLLVIVLTIIFLLVDFVNQYVIKLNDATIDIIKLILSIIFVVIINYMRGVWGISKNEFYIAAVFCGITYLLFGILSKYLIKY